MSYFSAKKTAACVRYFDLRFGIARFSLLVLTELLPMNLTEVFRLFKKFKQFGDSSV
jgi:hypothetical protein